MLESDVLAMMHIDYKVFLQYFYLFIFCAYMCMYKTVVFCLVLLIPFVLSLQKVKKLTLTEQSQGKVESMGKKDGL